MNIPEGWIIARETAVTELGDRRLGYTLLLASTIFSSEDEALKAIGALQLPLGWVIVPLVSVLSAAPTPPEVEPVTPYWPPVQLTIDEYLGGYELDDGEINHAPTQEESFLIHDAIVGLLNDDSFRAAYGVWLDAHRVTLPPSPQAEENAIDAAKYRAINTPEIRDFIAAVEREALHQRERWGSEHDAGKADADWFWLIGFLAGKAIRPDTTPEKQLHHIITTAAALLNWHSAKIGMHTAMRPGIGGKS